MLYPKRPKGQINLQLGLPIITYIAQINLVHAQGGTQNTQQYTLINLIQNNPPNLEDVRFSPTSIHPTTLSNRITLQCPRATRHSQVRSDKIYHSSTKVLVTSMLHPKKISQATKWNP